MKLTNIKLPLVTRSKYEQLAASHDVTDQELASLRARAEYTQAQDQQVIENLRRLLDNALKQQQEMQKQIDNANYQVDVLQLKVEKLTSELDMFKHMTTSIQQLISLTIRS
jgi:chromosome segregation ATPase